MIKFSNDILQFSGKYPKDMLEEFLRYWSELNKSRTKMRWELQPTWSTGGRLATWYKNYQAKIPTQGPGSRKNEYPENYGTISATAMTLEEYKAQKKIKDGSKQQAK